MIQSGILTKLRDVTDHVTEAEARACKYITGNADYVMNNSLQVISAASEVSEATIIRLCRKVDLSGYLELRLALAQDQAGHKIEAIHEDVCLDDGSSEILRKVFTSFVSALTDTLQIVDVAQFSGALEALERARSINFFGLGASGAAAQGAYFRFLRLGTPCYVLTDSSAQLSRVSMLGPGDVVIAISHSGRSKALVYAAQRARERGATCIAVTQFGQQPLVEASQFVLNTSSVETAFRSEAMASRVAQQALLDALFVAASMPRFEAVAAAIIENRRLTEQLNS